MRTSLVADALKAAATARGTDGLRGAIFHSDNGAQSVPKEFAQVCLELGVTRSRGPVGTSADNATAESLNATMKRETLQGQKRWNGACEARLAVFRWVTRYNTRRRHSRLGQPHCLRTAINYADHHRIATGVHDQGEAPVYRHIHGYPRPRQALFKGYAHT